jgi:hypothetical protein
LLPSIVKSSIVPRRDLDDEALAVNQGIFEDLLRMRLFSKEVLPFGFRKPGALTIGDSRASFCIPSEFNVSVSLTGVDSTWVITDLEILVRGVEEGGVPLVLNERQIIDVIAIAQQKIGTEQPLMELYKYLRKNLLLIGRLLLSLFKAGNIEFPGWLPRQESMECGWT